MTSGFRNFHYFQNLSDRYLKKVLNLMPCEAEGCISKNKNSYSNWVRGFLKKKPTRRGLGDYYFNDQAAANDPTA